MVVISHFYFVGVYARSLDAFGCFGLGYLRDLTAGALSTPRATLSSEGEK
jgi:hypothetical protein